MLHAKNNKGNGSADFLYNMATSVCMEASHSHVAMPDARMFDVVKMYLRLWRHTPYDGDIWLGRITGQCRKIRVRFLFKQLWGGEGRGGEGRGGEGRGGRERRDDCYTYHSDGTIYSVYRPTMKNYIYITMTSRITF